MAGFLLPLCEGLCPLASKARESARPKETHSRYYY